MSRYSPLVSRVLIAMLIGLTGCQPQQPFYFHQVDSDLDHYKGVATEISVPDVDTDRLADVANAQRPFSLANPDKQNYWDLTLEDAMQIAIRNSKVIRSLGGQVQQTPSNLLANPGGAETMYGPALAEANPRSGVEAALSAFDAQFQTALQWQRTNTPENVNPLFTAAGVFANISEHDIANFQSQLSKVTATGGQFALSHTVAYDMDRFAYQGNAPYNYASDWNVKIEASVRQPLFQGAGVQFNRIAGPGAQPGVYNGVILAKISSDVALADFEASVRNLVADVENAYWDLYVSYRALDAAVAGRDAALQTWRTTHTLNRVGSKGGEAEKEAQALQNYYNFQIAVEVALSGNGQDISPGGNQIQNTAGVYHVESRLRYLLGLAATDGRLIRPKDEPTTAKVSFDWCEVLNEGLARSVELRRQKSIVKASEMQLIAAKNFLLPKVDFVALYRWLGLGNDLLPVADGAGGDFTQDRSNAYQSLTSGAFQEWQVGLQANIPLGYRKELSGVRHAQLSLVQEQAKLQEQELELSHQLAFAIRDVETDYILVQYWFNQRSAAKKELEAVDAAYQTDTVTIDRVLEAQQKLALAESSYHASLVNYVKTIYLVHYHKGSLLEYNDVYLAEGPWPAKAYFDATRRARAREASTYMDYGFTQPRVMSRGPLEQMPGGIMPENAGEETIVPTATPNSTPNPKPIPKPREPELVPTPEPEATRSPTTSTVPVAPLPEEKSSEVVSAGVKENRGWNAVLTMPSAAKKADRQVADDWITVEKASYNEPIANPPTASVDRSASGWKGIQR